MENYKVVNSKGNEATESQIFGYLAYKLMLQSVEDLIEKGTAKVAGNDFTITEEAQVKLEGMIKHISQRWNTPVKAVKIIQKTEALEWEI